MKKTSHYDAALIRRLEASPTIIPDTIEESHKAHLALHYTTATKMG